MKILSTGATVSFLHNWQIIEGEVEAIARVRCGLVSIKVNGQWYSNEHITVVPQDNSRFGKSQMVRYVQKFLKIPVTLPDYWLDMIGYLGHEYYCKYAALYYSGSKAVWDNGLGMQTYPYYSAYQPLIEHFAVAYHLINAHLGSDDSNATQALIIDCSNPKSIELYVGNFGDVMRFLAAVAPKVEPVRLTEAEWEEVKKDFTFNLHKLGMFELFLGGSNEQSRMVAELTQHLDAYITEDLIKSCIESANYSNGASMCAYQLQLRLARIGRTRQ